MKSLNKSYFKIRNFIRYIRKNYNIKREVWGYILPLVIAGSIGVDAWYQNAIEPLKYIAPTVHAEEVKKPVIIEVDYSHMSEERIKEIILEKLPPIFVEIAKCEGGLKPYSEGPTNDHGALQISLDYHKEEVKKLGLDVVNNPYDNVKFAQVLYKKHGLSPWEASRKCWGKYLK